MPSIFGHKDITSVNTKLFPKKFFNHASREYSYVHMFDIAPIKAYVLSKLIYVGVRIVHRACRYQLCRSLHDSHRECHASYRSINPLTYIAMYIHMYVHALYSLRFCTIWISITYLYYILH